MLSGQCLKLLASLRYVIDISASACYARLSRGEQVKRDILPSSLAPVPVFILLGHLLRSVVNAGTGKD